MSGFTFPIGENQTLSIGSLSLTLEWDNFNADGDNAWGYKRIEVIEQQATLSNSLYGSSIIEGNFFEPKHQFEWSLYLDRDKAQLLYALWKEQQYRARNQQADLAIQLLDTRLAFLGRNPRDRAKIGSVISDPVPPTGFSYFWAQFDVFLELGTDFLNWYLTSSDHLFDGKIKGRELSIIPTTEDLP